MRTTTQTRNEYQWAELSQAAKEHAVMKYFSDYNWADDMLASLKAFAEHFGSKLKDYRIDWSGTSSPSHCDFEDPCLEPEDLERLVGELKNDGSCQWTGYCGDDSCNDGAIAAWKAGERDAVAILDAGFDTWLKSAHADYEAQVSEEGMADTCEANEYWFDEKGNLV